MRRRPCSNGECNSAKRRFAAKHERSHWPVLAATLLAAMLLGPRLGLHALWTDEAITALYARSLHDHPLPYAWDGRNLACFGDGGTLTTELYATTYPMLQFYVAWSFFELFGPTATAGRTPFVLIGLATVPLTYLLALRLFGSRTTAAFSGFLLAGSVSFLMFSRQCRYYALAMFFTALALLIYNRLSLRRPWTIVAFVAAGLLLFHSHFLIFFCFMGGMTVAFLLRERDRLWAMLVAGGALLLLTVPWMLIFTRPYGIQEAPLASGGRIMDSVVLLGRFLRDCNNAAFFPVLALPLLIFAVSGRSEDERQARKPVVFLIVIILTQLVLVSALAVQPTDITQEADLRYIVNLLPLMCILLGCVCAGMWKLHRAAGACVLALLIGTNVLTLQLPRSHIYDYVYELSHPYMTSTEAVIERLRRTAKYDDLALVMPEYQRAPLMFYLGDRLRFCAVLPADEKRILQRQNGLLPSYVYSGQVTPDWIIEFRKRVIREDIRAHLQQAKVTYAEEALQVFWQDQSRPELLWHRFKPWPPDSYADDERVFILRREAPSQSP